MTVHVRWPGQTSGPDSYRDGLALNFLLFLFFVSRQRKENSSKSFQSKNIECLVSSLFFYANGKTDRKGVSLLFKTKKKALIHSS